MSILMTRMSSPASVVRRSARYRMAAPWRAVKQLILGCSYFGVSNKCSRWLLGLWQPDEVVSHGVPSRAQPATRMFESRLLEGNA
jgi:hypothetical protein